MQRNHIILCVGLFLILVLIGLGISFVIVKPHSTRDCVDFTFDECQDGCECFRCDNDCFPQKLYNDTICVSIKTEIYTTNCLYKKNFIGNVLLYCFLGFTCFSLVIVSLMAVLCPKETKYTVDEKS